MLNTELHKTMQKNMIKVIEVALQTLVILIVIAYGASVQGQIVAQYDFETIAGNSNFIAGDLVLFDVSDSGLDFTTDADNASMTLTSDVASLMSRNTLAFRCDNSYDCVLATKQTSLFHPGQSGEITVEFWWKSIKSPQNSSGHLLRFETDGDLDKSAIWSIDISPSGELRFCDNRFDNSYEVSISAAAQDKKWHHVAFTIDRAGTLKSYFDGKLSEEIAFKESAGPSVSRRLRIGGQNASEEHCFLIDDLRILDVALLPGKGTGVAELSWKASLSKASPSPQRAPDFGRRWVRSHPFTIASWGFSDYPQLFKDANFNAVFGGQYSDVTASGITPMFLGTLLKLDDGARTSVQIAKNAGAKAFLYCDEMPIADAKGVKEVADYIRSVDSEALAIVGLGSSSPDYVNQAIKETQPDAVFHGFYPFNGHTSAEDQWYQGGLTDVALIRERALFYKVPYFAFIQSFEDFKTGLNPPQFARRLPSESELRSELFSKLSAGVKGVCYFVFQDGNLEDVALVTAAGEQTSLYAPAMNVNKEIAVLGNSLRCLESSDWRFVSGGVADTPAYMKPMDADACFGKLVAVSVDGSPADRRDALIGTFLDAKGGQYFMLVNTFHGQKLSASEAEVNFTLTFDPSVRSIWRLNRWTGKVEELSLDGQQLKITLPGGTGDLFKFSDGEFSSGTASPEIHRH
jgi:hypothetical protein